MNSELTPREYSVLLLLADGLQAPEIGQELHLSTHTIKTNIVHLRAKLQAKNAAHAVAIAYHKHILKIPGMVY